MEVDEFFCGSGEGVRGVLSGTTHFENLVFRLNYGSLRSWAQPSSSIKYCWFPHGISNTG